jgi:pimeloyl-ACP methyl ester carboxylesterase
LTPRPPVREQRTPVGVLEERWATISGRQLRYLVGGLGEPLLLCHGFLSSAEEFGGRFSALASHRTLIVPDLPGNATSEPLPFGHTVDDLTDAVDELLSQLGVDALDVGGLCLGASVACEIARRRGEAVGHLLLHTPLLRPGLVRARYRLQVRALALPVIWQSVVWLSRRRAVSDLYKRFVIQEGPVDGETADINFDNQRRADPRAAREWICDGLNRDDFAVIEGRTRPTLIIVAQNDRLVEVERLRMVIESLPHVSLMVDREGGHGWSEGAVRRHLEVLRPFFGDRPGE